MLKTMPQERKNELLRLVKIIKDFHSNFEITIQSNILNKLKLTNDDIFSNEFLKEIFPEIESIFNNRSSINNVSILDLLNKKEKILDNVINEENIYDVLDYIVNSQIKVYKNFSCKNVIDILKMIPSDKVDHLKLFVDYFSTKKIDGDINLILDSLFVLSKNVLEYIEPLKKHFPKYQNYPVVVLNEVIDQNEKKEVIKKTYIQKNMSKYLDFLSENLKNANDLDAFIQAVVIENNRVKLKDEGVQNIIIKIFSKSYNIGNVANIDKFTEKYRKYFPLKFCYNTMKDTYFYSKRSSIRQLISIMYKNVDKSELIDEIVDCKLIELDYLIDFDVDNVINEINTTVFSEKFRRYTKFLFYKHKTYARFVSNINGNAVKFTNFIYEYKPELITDEFIKVDISDLYPSTLLKLFTNLRPEIASRIIDDEFFMRLAVPFTNSTKLEYWKQTYPVERIIENMTILMKDDIFGKIILEKIEKIFSDSKKCESIVNKFIGFTDPSFKNAVSKSFTLLSKYKELAKENSLSNDIIKNIDEIETSINLFLNL